MNVISKTNASVIRSIAMIARLWSFSCSLSSPFMAAPYIDLDPVAVPVLEDEEAVAAVERLAGRDAHASGTGRLHQVFEDPSQHLDQAFAGTHLARPPAP